MTVTANSLEGKIPDTTAKFADAVGPRTFAAQDVGSMFAKVNTGGGIDLSIGRELDVNRGIAPEVV